MPGTTRQADGPAHDACDRRDAPIGVRPGSERRNLERRLDLRRRVGTGFHDIPWMKLTAQQAARCFGLPHDTCARILHELVEAGHLRRLHDGQFTSAASAMRLGRPAAIPRGALARAHG